jgi:tetratricopeptide (TPR) repeat protein
MRRAEEAARAALSVDDTSADAHHALGDVYWFHHWNLAAAEREFALCATLRPKGVLCHWGHFVFRSSMREDHERAIAEAAAARELDPLSVTIRTHAGWVFHWARQHGRALEQCLEVLATDPECAMAYQVVGLAAMAQSLFDEAITALRWAMDRFGGSIVPGFLGMAYGRAGQHEQAREILAQLEQQARAEPVPAICFAWIHIGLGDFDQAFDWMERAYTEHDPHLLWLRVGPQYDPLRGEPRYKPLLDKLNLPPPAE